MRKSSNSKNTPAAEKEEKNPNRIEKDGENFRVVIGGEFKSSHAFFATAAAAFETETGRPPGQGDYDETVVSSARAPEKVPEVINGARITACDDPPGGFEVRSNGRLVGWRKTIQEAEALLAEVKAGKKAPPESKPAEGPPAPLPRAAEPEKPAKKSQKGSKKAEKAPVPASEESPKSDPPEPEKAPELVGPVHPALLAYAADEAGRHAALVSILAEAPNDLFRAEAERRGMRLTAARPSNGARSGNRGPANKAEHAELTKKAWTKARELAKAKGGKPQDHMKEAWAGLVRD